MEESLIFLTMIATWLNIILSVVVLCAVVLAIVHKPSRTVLARFLANLFGNWNKDDEFELSAKKQIFIVASVFAMLWPPVGLIVLVSLCESATSILKQPEIIAAVVDYLKSILTYYAIVLPVLCGGYVGGKYIDAKTDGSSTAKGLNSDDN